MEGNGWKLINGYQYFLEHRLIFISHQLILKTVQINRHRLLFLCCSGRAPTQAANRCLKSYNPKTKLKMEVNTMPNEKFVETIEGEEEIAFDVGDLSLRFWVNIYEEEDSQVPAKRIIWGKETYYAKANWKLNGKLARHIDGTWRVKIDLESIGKAKEYTSPKTHIIPMVNCNQDEYSTTFALKPGDLNPHKDGTVYQPAVTLSTLDPCGGDGHIWAYVVGPNVMFINTKESD